MNMSMMKAWMMSNKKSFVENFCIFDKTSIFLLLEKYGKSFIIAQE
jgi:hypothetical protein